VSVSDDKVASIRLPGDLAAALKRHAEENGETLSDAMRRGALMVLGICPTCGRPAGDTPATAEQPDPGPAAP
jgi:hypothetical protein